VRSLAHAAASQRIEPLLFPRLKAYITAASAEDPTRGRALGARRSGTSPIHDLLTAITQVPASRPACGNICCNRRATCCVRTTIGFISPNDATAPIKWFAILLFGTITQIGLLLSHVEDRRTMRINVALFTIAFAFCLIIIAIFDAPYDIAVPDEPGKTLSLALEGL